MMTFALFRDGVFAETRRLPSRPEDIPHKGVEWFPVGETVTGENVGWAVFDGEAVQTAAPPAPQSTDPQDYPLNKVQFHAMVGILGKKAAIETAIAGIADDTHRAIAEAKYIHSDRFDRDDALFDALAPAVWPELTEAERTATIDAAWMHAKDIA